MRTNVVHVINSLATGGAERLLLDMAPHWDTDRFQVRYVYLLDEGAQHEELEACPVESEGIGLRGWLDPFGARRLFERLRDLRPDVLHTHLMLADCLARPWGLRHRVPAVVTTLHSSAPHFFDRPGLGGRIMAQAYREVMERTRRAHTIACSREIVASFERINLGVGELTVVENGVDLDRVWSVPDEERARVRDELGLDDRFACLTVARLSVPKGHDTLIAAAAELLAEDIVFVLVGDGERRGELEAQAELAGVAHLFRFLGNREDIPRLLHASDLFVLPSRWEGRPISVMEAMAASLPVVATDVGGIAGMVPPEAGLVVPAGRPKELAKAIRAFKANPARRADAGAAALREARARFDVRVCVREYERLYDSLTAQRQR